ncbi:hypothetical protein BCR32DRAFT_223307 [Anaeromyces robustus]|uniref:Core domain-containing protein n=1 Tax=Anaeromyces robustus TaxID=1754192 RepID=A0A1Y1WW70_9FUNG|nr:hypothetical protein BCR32DRAFT_223307 [Anaeromyces robustus]|eukprot:ORX77558.1 hypothetical protein BCR32DRAFT_223307 [Anaeromyces robustus]
MQNLIIKKSISNNLLKKTPSISLINKFNKYTIRQYTSQQNKILVNTNYYSLLNKSYSTVPSIPLNSALLFHINNNVTTSIQNSFRNYATEKDKSSEEKNKPKDSKTNVEEEEEEEEEEDEIKNITDMKIKITDAAAERLNEINDNSKQYLRIVVEAGGCHGFQYLLDLTENIDPDDDIIFEKNGAKVVVDTMSLPYIDGATLNYKDDLMGSSFQIVDNPNATEGCGCGNSFSV